MNEDSGIIKELSSRFRSLDRDVVFVHSDILGGLAVERPTPFDRTQFLANHYQVVRTITGDCDLWFPQFCYSFARTGVFDQKRDKSQVGYLSEYVRTHVSNWRTPVPFFSVSGTGPEPELASDSPIDPFGKGSIFDRLYQRDGSVFNYGCDLSSLTHIHYCESLAGSPYRYAKEFTGGMIDMHGTETSVRVTLHVRPLEFCMSYDWKRLQTDLVDEGILERLSVDDREFQILHVRQVTDYWLGRLSADPLFFLSNDTRSWVEPKLETLGRGFVIDDFESSEVVQTHG